MEEAAAAQLRGAAQRRRHVRPGGRRDGRTEPRPARTDTQAASSGPSSHPAAACGARSGAGGPPPDPAAAARAAEAAAAAEAPARLDSAHQRPLPAAPAAAPAGIQLPAACPDARLPARPPAPALLPSAAAAAAARFVVLWPPSPVLAGVWGQSGREIVGFSFSFLFVHSSRER